MAFSNRPPRPKFRKIKSSTVLQKYRRDNPYCEICALDNIKNTFALELHHIIPNTERTDELYNIIMLCQLLRRLSRYLIGISAAK